MFDSLIKRSFSGLVLALVALIACVHAGIAMQFVAMALIERRFLAAGSAAPRRSGATTARDPGRSAAILERNAFDSVTGPLTEKADAALVSVTAAKAVSDPLAVPLCEGVAAAITTQSSDRTWSFASLRASGDANPRMRRVGDAFDGKQVAFIGYNPRQNSPAVWLARGDDLCQVVLFHGTPVPPAESAALAKPSTSRVPPEIVSRIHKLSDSEFQIERPIVDRLLEDQSQFMKDVRIVPEHEDGVAVGIRLFGIRPDGLLGLLGLQSGDRLDTLNGYRVANPERALEAYVHLRFASNVTMVVNRRGAPVTIDYRIQ